MCSYNSSLKSLFSFILTLNVSSPHQFMNQTRQGMSMKMESMGSPAMRPGMQPSMGGQVKYTHLPLVTELKW